MPRARRVRIALSAAVLFMHAASSAAGLLIASTPVPALDARERSLPLAMQQAHGDALRRIAQGQPGTVPGNQASYRSAVLVLDDVQLTPEGARGGYFYKMYLVVSDNVPPGEQQLIGTLGPFEVAAARQRGETSLRYPLAGPLTTLGAQASATLHVLFRRAGGAAVPDGPLLAIGALRLELSTDAVQ